MLLRKALWSVILHIKLNGRLVYDTAERHDGFLDCLAAMILSPETDQQLGKGMHTTILVLVLCLINHAAYGMLEHFLARSLSRKHE